MATINNALI